MIRLIEISLKKKIALNRSSDEFVCELLQIRPRFYLNTCKTATMDGAGCPLNYCIIRKLWTRRFSYK